MLASGAPESDVASIGFDGKEYWEVEQLAAGTPADYKVERTCDGGITWVSVNECRGNINSCTVTMLPAGTTCGFRVRAGSVGGWGVASVPAMAKMVDSDTSIKCTEEVYNEMNGSGSMSNGTIVAIVLGIIAGLLAIAFTAFVLKRRSPPPPPPDFKGAPPGY